MARIRTIKPDFWTDGTIIKLSPFARLLYIGMWNFALCDSGHVDDDLLRLKLQVLPMDNVDIESLLQELMDSGRVARISLENGETYLHVVRLRDHQKVDNRWIPRCPACKEEGSPELAETRVSLDETRRDSPELAETHPGRERKGKESKGGEGKGKTTPHPIPSDFSLTPERRQWSMENTPALNPQLVTDEFIDYWANGGGSGKRKSNWETTWRNWMRRKQGDAEQRGWKPKPPPGKDLSDPKNW